MTCVRMLTIYFEEVFFDFFKYLKKPNTFVNVEPKKD